MFENFRVDIIYWEQSHVILLHNHDGILFIFRLQSLLWLEMMHAGLR